MCLTPGEGTARRTREVGIGLAKTWLRNVRQACARSWERQGGLRCLSCSRWYGCGRLVYLRRRRSFRARISKFKARECPKSVPYLQAWRRRRELQSQCACYKRLAGNVSPFSYVYVPCMRDMSSAGRLLGCSVQKQVQARIL